MQVRPILGCGNARSNVLQASVGSEFSESSRHRSSQLVPPHSFVFSGDDSNPDETFSREWHNSTRHPIKGRSTKYGRPLLDCAEKIILIVHILVGLMAIKHRYIDTMTFFVKRKASNKACTKDCQENRSILAVSIASTARYMLVVVEICPLAEQKARF